MTAHRPDGTVARLLLPRNRTALEVLVATGAYFRLYGTYPERGRVARLLNRSPEYVARIAWKLERWGLVVAVRPVGARRIVLWALKNGLSALEELVGY